MNKNLPALNEYLDQNPDIGETLYYPGGYDDLSPFKLFGLKSSLRKYIYADYAYEKNKHPVYLPDYLRLTYEELTPETFGKNSWLEFWHENEKSHEFASGENAFGCLYKTASLLREEDEPWWIDYYVFGTEAIQTYKILIENNLKPDVLVLQDHGMGGFWNHFGVENQSGETSYMYEIAKNHLPEYIFANGQDIESGPTHVWPGYERITQPIKMSKEDGSMHEVLKALYKRKM